MLKIRDFQRLEAELDKKTRSEVIELFYDRENNKEEILVRHYRYILDVLNKSGIKYSMMDDMFSEGLLGMLKAIEEYDPTRNISFLSFADFHIRKEVYRAIPNYGNIVFPDYFHQLLRIVKLRMNDGCDLDKLIESNFEKICPRSNLENVTKDIKFYLDMNCLSSDAERENFEENSLLVQPSFEEESLNKINSSNLMTCINSILGNKVIVFNLKKEGKTFKEMGEYFGVSSQMAHNKYNDCCRIIRNNKRKIKEYI